MMRIILIFLLLCTPALAHDPSHRELNEWFNRLAYGKGLCCSFADGSVVSDVDWESHDGHYRVRLEGRWVDVPDDAVSPSRTAPAELWFGPTRPIAGPIIRVLKFGASCPAAWAKGAGSGPRLFVSPMLIFPPYKLVEKINMAHRQPIAGAAGPAGFASCAPARSPLA